MKVRFLTRPKNLLSAREVLALPDGAHSDGDRLMIKVRGGRAQAIFRYVAPDGRRREAGLGVIDRSSLKAAGESLVRVRAKADLYRGLLDRVDENGQSVGIDPLERKAAARAAAKSAEAEERRRRRSSLLQCARDYHERVIEGRRSTRHAIEWLASIERHLPRALLAMPVDQITAPMLFDALAPLQAKVPETAGRVRQRLQKIFADAEFRGLCKGNPADACANKLRDEAGQRARQNYRALDWREVPAFMAKLRDHAGVAHRLLEFTILTAARTNESRLMTRGEVDLERGRWVIPAERMKARREHVVTLSPRAAQIVEQMRALRDELKLDTDYVFPSLMKPGRPLSGMAMLMLTRKMGYGDKVVTHGFRSSFSDWAYTSTSFRAEVIESCLAHVEGKGSKVKRAYLRTNFEEECGRLLRQWHDFLLGESAAANVIALPAKVVHTA